MDFFYFGRGKPLTAILPGGNSCGRKEDEEKKTRAGTTSGDHAERHPDGRKHGISGICR